MKAFFWFALGLTLLVWGSAYEQRVAIACMGGGHLWRPAQWYELTGRCAPGKAPRLLLLPPMQINPPTLDAPEAPTWPEL